jgi:hypothetical protein
MQDEYRSDQQEKTGEDTTLLAPKLKLWNLYALYLWATGRSSSGGASWPQSRNAWYASELALAQKAGYQQSSSQSPVLDERQLNHLVMTIDL